MSLAILLTTPPEHQDAQTVLSLARAALAQGRAVRIFLMEEGVFHLVEGEVLRALAEAGAEIALCAHNAEERHLSPPPDIPHLCWGSQYDFALITAESDRVLSFT